MTSSGATPSSGDAFSDSTFTGEGGTCLILPSLSPTSCLLLRSPPLAPAVCKLPVLPTPPVGVLGSLFSTPAPSVLSPLALSEQMHLLFLGFLSPPLPPRPPPAPGSPRPSSRLPAAPGPFRPWCRSPGAGRLSRGRCPGGRRGAGRAGERRDRGKGERESWPGGRGSPSEPEGPGEKGASEWEARTADRCSRRQRLRAAPQSLQLVTLEPCPGTAESQSGSPAERYQSHQEQSAREGFPGNAEAEPMEEQCRLQKKTLACSPGGARASRLQPPAPPRPSGWFLGWLGYPVWLG